MYGNNTIPKAYRVGIIAAPFIFYIIYWFADGAIWCADSISYVTMYDAREPLYPLILAMVRRVVGYRESLPVEAQPYLFYVAGIQSLLAAYAVISLTRFLTARYRLSGPVSIAVMMIPLGVSILNRYAARRGSMYSNCILTEGIAISLYLLLFRYELEYILTGRRGAFIASALISFAGISLRKQMYVMIGLIIAGGIVRAFLYIRSKERLKPIISSLACAVIVIMAAALFDHTYNYVLRGTFIGHTEDNRFVATMAFYTAEREDVSYIDPGLREVFLEIYDECDQNGYLYHSAPRGPVESVNHFSDNYDHIQLDVMQPHLERTVEELEYDRLKDAQSHSEKMDMVREEFNSSLLSHHTGRVFKVILYNFVSGLVLTAARFSYVFILYAVVVYAVFVYLAVNAVKRKAEPDALVLTVMTAAGIILNSALVSAVIFCQTRYMIYNMPLLYIAVVILFIKNRRNVNPDRITESDNV